MLDFRNARKVSRGPVAILALVTCLAATTASGDNAFRRGDFSKAANDYAAALASDPNDAVAALGLGTIRLYENKLDQAERLLTAEPLRETNDGNANRSLAEIARRREASASDNSLVSGVTTVAVSSEMMPIVAVRLDERRDAKFVIDTGAPEVLIDSNVAQEIGLAPQGGGEITFPGGQRGTAVRTTLDSVQIGDAEARNLNVVALPLRQSSYSGAPSFEGALGPGFLYHFLVTIDYPHRRVEVRPRSDSATFERTAKTRGDAVLPMWLARDQFILTRARVNDGPEQLFTIDTGGSNVGLTVSSQTLDNSHVVLDRNHPHMGVANGGVLQALPFTAKLKLGPFSEEHVVGAYIPAGSYYESLPFSVAGAISDLALRPYAVTFDFVAMHIVLHRGPVSP